MTYKPIAEAHLIENNYERAEKALQTAVQSLPEGKRDKNKMKQIKDTIAKTVSTRLQKMGSLL